MLGYPMTAHRAQIGVAVVSLPRSSEDEHRNRHASANNDPVPDQETLTFSPLGPFGPCPRSNVTAWPSRRSSNRVPVHAELWKKYSFPSSARMNPKPLSLTSRLIVPFIDAILSP